MEVIIIGAGLNGLALSIGLAKLGNKVSVYDKFDLAQVALASKGGPVTFEFGDVGGHVMVQTNGLRVLKRLGVLESVLDQGYTETGTIETANMDGTGMATLRITPRSQERDILYPCQILRSRLHAILLRSCQSFGVRVFTGKTIVEFEEINNRVKCNFEDGTSAEGDLLVGADGIHSATRRLLFGPEHTAEFTGIVGYLGVTDVKDSDVVSRPLVMYLDRLNKREVAVCKVAPTKVAWRVSEYAEPDEEASDTYRPYSNLPKESARLSKLVESWNAPAHVVTCIRDSARISPVVIYDLPDLSSFHKSRVVLVGDAAHGMRPNMGMGLSMGLEDVGVLYELFAGCTDLKRVLELYDQLRVPRTHKFSARARSAAANVYADTPFKAKMAHLTTKVAYGFLNMVGARMEDDFVGFDSVKEVNDALYPSHAEKKK
ncbi:hypothetical protein CcCBS67573_g07033 [Chytriomyces confervae]|uniref:FAD-binding domain-containing protein n=1 Tax=Chytriomyces confervae TaxID=246404 RepID=A0A507F0B4_9FUNG|nr:hypothetical protein CcCBS67573_g07033 [Chytriomyces confervae]